MPLMLLEPPRMRPWNQLSLRPFNASTGSVSKFQLRRTDVLAMKPVPGIFVVSPSLSPPASIRAMQVTPAMGAGIETRLWSMDDVARVIQRNEDFRSGALLVS
jgi:hypothetical protein